MATHKVGMFALFGRRSRTLDFSRLKMQAPSPIATLSSSSLEFPSPRLLINLLDSAGKSLGLQAWHAHFIVRPLISSVRLASTTDMIDRIEVYLCSSVHIHFTITIIPYLNEGLLSRL